MTTQPDKQQPKFNLMQLCTRYNVYNDAKTEFKTIAVIEYGLLAEIIQMQQQTAQGTLVDEFCGFVQSPYHITWYAQPIDKFNLEHAVNQCIGEGNDIVITQILPLEEITDK